VSRHEGRGIAASIGLVKAQAMSPTRFRQTSATETLGRRRNQCPFGCADSKGTHAQTVQAWPLSTPLGDGWRPAASAGSPGFE
jgi:hypothetical protein